MSEDNKKEEVVEEPVQAPVNDEEVTKRAFEAARKLDEATARMEKTNAELNALLLKQQTLQVEKTLAGSADAGSDKPKDESPGDYAKKVMEGLYDNKKESKKE